MIGIGPFLPHQDTPFCPIFQRNARTTLLLLSIFRLMHPSALIPSTTALATLTPDGRERGILAGANVVMPNLSPQEERKKYTLYNNKASLRLNRQKESGYCNNNYITSATRFLSPEEILKQLTVRSQLKLKLLRSLE